jgi:hypothetical protein
MTKVKKIWLIVILAVGLIVGAVLYVLNKRNKTGVVPARANIKDLKLSLASAKANAKTSQKQAAALGSYTSLANMKFTNSLISNYAAGEYENPSFLPMTDMSSDKFSKANQEINLAALNKLIEKYDTEVTRQSVLWKVPRWMIYGIMLNENTAGIADLPDTTTKAKYTTDTLSGKTIEYAKQYGLGQVKPYSATDTLRRALKNGILQIDHAQALKNLANGDRIDKALSKTALGDIVITGKELEIPEFNIAVIAADLANGILAYGTELYKVVASYNQGYYYVSNNGLGKYKSFSTFYAKAKTDVQTYLKNTCGNYGSFTLAVYYANIKD